MKKRLSLFHQNNSRQIFVLGSLNMDFVYSLDRIPEQGETYYSNSFMFNSGGKGSNQAVACQNFGLNASLIGSVGNDLQADILLNDLLNYDVDISFIKRSHFPTGNAVILLTKGDNRIILNGGANHDHNLSHIAQALSDSKPNDYFLTQLEIPLEMVHQSLILAKKKGLVTVLNPSPVQRLEESIFEYVDILIMNEIEASQLSNKLTKSTEIIPYFLSKGIQQVVITMGAKGVYYNDNQSICHKASLKTKVVDTTAAGDTFSGALLAELSRKSTIHDAIQMAIFASTMTIEKEGAQKSMPTRQEVIHRFLVN